MEDHGIYDDLLDRPHPVSSRHPRMAMTERAAQFSPFAALTGYGETVRETARLTEEKRELTADQQQEIDRRLKELQERLFSDPVVTAVYFEADPRKEGGSYQTVTGTVRKLDPERGTLTFSDGTVIPFGDLLSLE